MADFNDIMANFGEHEKEVNKEKEKPEYEKTQKEKNDEFVKNVKSFADWFRIPLNILILMILAIGASLMFLSVNSLTGNVFISVLSISISEAGILGWESARERFKNTETQTRVASIMRWWHVGTSVLLLVINFIVESATQMLSIRVDGIVYVIFIVIGITSLADLISFFIYGDNDRDDNNKKMFNQKIEKLNADTTSRKLDSWARAEEIRNQALVEYWERNAGSLAELTGRIQASKQIREEYAKAGLTTQEIDEMIQSINRKGVVDDIVKPALEQPISQIPPKRHYTPRKPKNVETEVKPSSENFQDGAVESQKSETNSADW